MPEDDSRPGGNGYWYDIEDCTPSDPVDENVVGGWPKFHIPDVGWKGIWTETAINCNYATCDWIAERLLELGLNFLQVTVGAFRRI